MRRSIESSGLGDEDDRRFHAAVTAAAHSPILAEFYRQLAPQISESRTESLRQPGRPARSLVQHQQIVAAIRARAARRAVTAVRGHVRTVGDVRLLAWEPGADES
jgi:GntR family transcriptional repressor for pyruvate dehydrogenase complex